jgi:hypothetical protein
VESASTALSPSADVFCEMLRASCLALLAPAHSPN